MPARHAVLAQTARTLLLAQSSDWQFIMSTGVVADYGERRFKEHCSDLERLLQGLGSDSAEEFGESAALAERLRHRDDLFPDVLAGVRRALGGSRAPGGGSAPSAS
jgi:1,4-alpha-glucan branching enzyme